MNTKTIMTTFEDGILVSKEVKNILNSHKFKIGQLVEVGKLENKMLEILNVEPLNKQYEGVRAFIVNLYHTEYGDCMYDLSINKDSYIKMSEAKKELDSGKLNYGSKEYIEQVAKYHTASGSIISSLKEKDLF